MTGRIKIISLLLLIPALVSAQQQIDIGEVLVEESSLLDALGIQYESVSHKFVIPHAELVAFGYATAGDVIKNLPLVYIDGDPGINRNVSIAGLPREYQAILINGKQPAGGEDSRDLKLDRIPVSMIERIEIDYNAPVSEGTPGIAGSVNIVLKKESAREGLNIQMMTSVNSTDPIPRLRFDADGTFGLGKATVYGGVAFNRYERNKTTTLIDTSTSITGAIDESIKTTVAGFNLAASMPAGRYGEAGISSFFNWFDEDEFEDAEVKRRKDGTLNIRESITENDKLRYLLTTDLYYSYQKGRNQFEVNTGFSNNYEKRHKSQLSEKSDYFEEGLENEDQDNYSFTGNLRYRLDSIATGSFITKFEAGADLSSNIRRTDRVNATRPEGYLLWDITDESYTLDENIAAGWFSLESNIAENLTLLPALNYEYSTTSFQTADTTGSGSYRNLSPSLHVRYRPNQKWRINGGFSHHISRPAFMSMVPVSKVKIKKDVIEVGNPDLVPSRALALDVGATYYMNKGSWITFSLYNKWVRDMIELKYIGIDESTGYNLYSFVNIDTARLYGFYVDMRLDPSPGTASGITYRVAWSYMGSSVRDPLTGGVRRIDDQPEHLVSFKADWLSTRLKTALAIGSNFNTARIIAPFISDEGVLIAETRESAYISIEARIKYYFSKRGSIYFSGDNLLMRPVIIEQGPVTERTRPGAIVRFGINLNIL